MSTLSDLLAEHTALPGAAVAHLQRLVSEWQLLADLSFSDLTVWVPHNAGPDGNVEYVCVAQVRPTTGATVHLDDMVSARLGGDGAELVRRGMADGEVTAEVPDPAASPLVPKSGVVRLYHREVVPIRFGDQVVAVISR